MLTKLLCIFAAAILVGMASAMPTPVQPKEPVDRNMTDDQLTEYLLRYGHWMAGPQDMVDDSILKKSIESLQRFAGLKVTGEIDAATRELLATPRCGLSDHEAKKPLDARKKRYVQSGAKWSKTTLTFLILNYSSKLQPKDTRQDIIRAMKFWSDVSPLTFKESSTTNADIVIRFARRSHGDSSPFDGPGGVLAHAFYPESGNTHFDEDESWSHNSYTGVNLLQIATHELGHALGLAHTSVSSAIMAPYYKGYIPTLALAQDDIDAIQSLYGPSQSSDSITSRSEPDVRPSSVPPSSAYFPTGIPTSFLRVSQMSDTTIPPAPNPRNTPRYISDLASVLMTRRTTPVQKTYVPGLIRQKTSEGRVTKTPSTAKRSLLSSATPRALRRRTSLDPLRRSTPFISVQNRFTSSSTPSTSSISKQ